MNETATLADLIASCTVKDGTTETPIPELTVVRISAPFACTPVVYGSSLCVVGQGRKRARLGDHAVTYDPLNYLVCSLPLPVESEIEDASPAAPFLGLVITMDPTIISQILLEIDEFIEWPDADPATPALTTSRLSADLERAVKRLLIAAHDPMARRVLAPGLLREVYYEALRGNQGHLLRSTVLRDNNAHRIARVVRYLEQSFRQPLDVETLARHAGMSSSALHLHFKQATTMSPMQYVKKLRLHHAKAKLLAGNGAAQTAFEVGYASPSQFSREFRRLFGVAPNQVRPSTERLTRHSGSGRLGARD